MIFFDSATLNMTFVYNGKNVQANILFGYVLNFHNAYNLLVSYLYTYK